MLKKIFLLLLFPAFVFSQSLRESRTSSYHTLIYKLSNEEARQLFKKSLDSSFLHTVIDSFPTDSIYKKKLAPGNYVFIRAQGRLLDCELKLVNDFQVELMKEGAELALGIYDSSGKMIPDAKLSVDKKAIRFDAEKHLYRIPKANEQGILIAEVGEQMAVYDLDKSIHNGRFIRTWKKISNSIPMKYLFYPFKKTYWLIRRGFHIRHRKADKGRGYLAFSKPKYLPGDTVKLKSFIVSKRGNPLRKSMRLVISQESSYPRKEILGDTLLPVSPGSYSYEFRLGDTLTLNKYYKVELRRKKKKIYRSESFYLEDYQLDKTKYKLRAEKNEFSLKEPVQLFASGTDANGFPVMDGRVELTVKSTEIKNFYPSSVFIPDTIWRKELEIEPLGETKIVIPDSLLPEAKLQLKIQALFNNSSNETHDTTITITVDRAKHFIKLIAGDSVITGEMITEGISKPASGKWYGYRAYSELVFEKHVSLPFSEPVNPLIEKYRLLADGQSAELKIEEASLLQLSGVRTKDSVFFSFINPKSFPVHYTIYKNWKEIESGFASSLNWATEDKSETSWFIACNYVWAGEPVRQVAAAHIFDKNLNIKIKQPEKVYPGQETEVKIKVSNYEGEPVGNVNLLASAVNSEFRSLKIPQIPYLGKRKKGAPSYNWFKLHRNRDLQAHSYFRLDEKWRKRFTLDMLLFYQMIYPKDGIKLHYDSIPVSHAEFAPHLFDGGKGVAIYLIWLDNQLIYYFGVNATFPFSFVAGEGYHSIKLRTRNATYVIDSVLLKKGNKLDIAVDVNHLPENVSVHEEKTYFSETEKNLLNKSLFCIQNIYNKDLYVWQKDNIQLYNYNYSGKFKILTFGPFQNLTDLNVGVKDKFVNTFQFESGYYYIVNEQKIKMKDYHLFTEKKPQLHERFREPRMGETAFTERDILLATPASPKSPFSINIPASTFPGNGAYRFKMDSILYSIIISMPGDTGNIWIVYGSRRMLYDLSPAYYCFYFVTKNGFYLKRDSVKITENGTLCEQFENPEFRRLDADDAILKKYLYIIHNIDSFESHPSQSQFINDTYRFGVNSLCGTVTDKDNEPLIAANVIVEYKGAIAMGAVTDLDGRYCFHGLAGGEHEIVVRYIGFDNKFIKYYVKSGQNTLDVVLDNSSMNLEAVMVTTSKHQETLRESVSAKSLKSMAYYSPAALDLNYLGPQRGVSQLNQLSGLNTFRGTYDTVNGDNFNTGAYLVGQYLDSTDFQAKSLRDKFSDYAYWQPNLITDENGEVSFKATFPDNITQWQSYAIGMDGRKHSGIGYSSIRSYKKVAAQLSVPRFMVLGDTAFVIGKALNYTGTTYPITTTFTIDEEEKSRKSDSVKTSVVENYQLVAQKPDSIAVTYLLETDEGYKDGEKYKVPVYPAGVKETEGSFHVLSGDTSISLHSKQDKGTVTLYIEDNPLDMLLKHLDDIRNYPYDCNEQLASKLMAYLMEMNINKTLGQEFKHEKVVGKLIKKLEQNRKPDGAWGWWKDSETNLWMTLYVMKALHKAGQMDFKINSLNPTTDFVRWNLEQLSENDLLNALSTLSEMKEQLDYEKLLSKFNYDSLSLYHKMLLLKIKKENALNYPLADLLSLKKETYMGGIYWGEYNYSWYDNSIQLTLLAYNILKGDSAGNQYLQGIRRYLIKTRENGRWRNTIETARVLETILPDILKEEKEIKPAAISINGETLHEFPFRKTFDAGADIRVQKSGTSEVYVTSYQQYFNTSPIASDKDFVVKTSFSSNGQATTTLKAGQPVILTVEVDAKKTGEYIMLEIPVPASCSYGNNTRNRNYYESHREYFKNKTTIFCQRLPQGKHVFQIHLEPRFKGSYTLNPAQAELMYFPTFSGRNETKKIRVN